VLLYTLVAARRLTTPTTAISATLMKSAQSKLSPTFS
jgi:hypothetical protein